MPAGITASAALFGRSLLPFHLTGPAEDQISSSHVHLT